MQLLRTLVLLSLLAVLGCASEHAPGIGGAKARALMARGAVLVDVRSGLEHEYWSPIEGSINIPFGELEGKLAALDKSRPVIVYSRTGDRSAKAKDLLEKAGYDAHNLGGLADWDR